MYEGTKKYSKKYPTCQPTKRQRKKHGKLPPKEAEIIPWQKLCIDIILYYQIPINSQRKKYESEM